MQNLIIYAIIAVLFCLNILRNLRINNRYRHPVGVLYELGSVLQKKGLKPMTAALLSIPVLLVMGALWPVMILVEFVVRFKQVTSSFDLVSPLQLLNKGFTKVEMNNSILYVKELRNKKIEVINYADKIKWEMTIEARAAGKKIEIKYSAPFISRKNMHLFCSQAGLTIDEIDFWKL